MAIFFLGDRGGGYTVATFVMELIFDRAGVSEAHVAAIQAKLAAQLRRDLDRFTEVAVARLLAAPGYERVTADMARPNTRRLVETYLADLEGSADVRYGAAFRDNALQRARAGFSLRRLLAISDLFEALLRDLAASCFQDPRDLLAGTHIARRLCDATRSVSLEACEQVEGEAQAERDRLMKQFSTPILPVLPGVLVLPVVGPVSSARAGQLLEAMLAGVGQHAAHTAILDITGLTDADASLAGHLNRIASATKLLGARFVLAGAGAGVATLLVSAGARLDGVASHATLADALLAVTRDEHAQAARRS